MFKRSFIGYNPKSVNDQKDSFESQMNEQIEQIDKAFNQAVSEQNELAEQIKLVTSRIDESLLGTVIISKYQDDLSVVLEEFQSAAREKMAGFFNETQEFNHEIEQEIEQLDEKIGCVKRKINMLANGLAGVAAAGDQEEPAPSINFDRVLEHYSKKVEESGVSLGNLKTRTPSEPPVYKDADPDLLDHPAEPDQYVAPMDNLQIDWKNIRPGTGEEDGPRLSSFNEDLTDAAEDGNNEDKFLQKLRKSWMD